MGIRGSMWPLGPLRLSRAAVAMQCSNLKHATFPSTTNDGGALPFSSAASAFLTMPTRPSNFGANAAVVMTQDGLHRFSMRLRACSSLPVATSISLLSHSSVATDTMTLAAVFGIQIATEPPCNPYSLNT